MRAYPVLKRCSGEACGIGLWRTIARETYTVSLNYSITIAEKWEKSETVLKSRGYIEKGDKYEIR